MGIDLKLTGVPDFNNFEIVKSGNGTFPSLVVSNPGAGKFGSGEAITTIAHNLGYTPTILIYLQEAGGGLTLNFIMPSISMVALSAGTIALWQVFQAYADQTNIYLLTDTMVYGASNTTGGTGFECKYYLLRETVKPV